MARKRTDALDETPKARHWLGRILITLIIVLGVGGLIWVLNSQVKPQTIQGDGSPSPSAQNSGSGNPSASSSASGSSAPSGSSSASSIPVYDGPVTPNIVTGEPSKDKWEGETKSIDVYVDGWSMRTLDTTALSAHTDVTDAITPMNLKPLNKDEINAVLKKHPNVVAQVLARMVTVDSGLTCTKDGCKGTNGPIDAGALLADPGSIPGYGESYTGWVIPSGLYAASVKVPKDASIMSVQGKNWEGSKLTIEGTSSEAAQRSEEGWGDGGYLLSAAWGLIFPVNAQWYGPNATAFTRVGLGGLPTAQGVLKNDWAKLQLLTGLADTTMLPLVDTLTMSQMAYMTSPTSGCGSTALCIPGKITPTASNEASKSTIVCDAAGAKGSIVYTTGDVSFNLGAPTHLAGVWNGDDPKDFTDAGKTPSVLPFSGLPPLANGDIKFKEANAVLLDSYGRTVALMGARNDSGAPMLANDLTKLFDGAFTTCIK